MEFSSLETVLVSERTGFVTVQLHRPKARNAMSLQMVDELMRVRQWLRSQPQVRALVLRGHEGQFCAGGDIKDMAGARAQAMQGIRVFNEHMNLFRYITLYYCMLDYLCCPILFYIMSYYPTLY